MSAEKKYIEELFTDALPVDEKEIVEALKPVVTIQRNSKEIFLKNEKILKMLGYSETEIISASEVYEKTGIKKGSIDFAFKSLRGNFLFGKRKSYEIPNYKVSEIVKRFREKFKGK